MALRIDLYHECRAEQLARKRDPLKIAMLTIIVVAVLLIAYYGIRLQRVGRVRAQASQIESELKAMTDKQTKAKAREAELATTIKTSDLLLDRIEKRFYWAGVLGQFLQTVPREVQILKFEGDYGSDTTKKCNVVLHGVSVGDEPRTVAETLRTTLENNFIKRYPAAVATFKALEDSNDSVQIDGRKRPTANFSINLDLPNLDAVKPGTAGGRAVAGTPAAPLPKKR
jgi:hypothetical protein